MYNVSYTHTHTHTHISSYAFLVCTISLLSTHANARAHAHKHTHTHTHTHTQVDFLPYTWHASAGATGGSLSALSVAATRRQNLCDVVILKVIFILDAVGGVHDVLCVAVNFLRKLGHHGVHPAALVIAGKKKEKNITFRCVYFLAGQHSRKRC